MGKEGKSKWRWKKIEYTLNKQTQTYRHAHKHTHTHKHTHKHTHTHTHTHTHQVSWRILVAAHLFCLIIDSLIPLTKTREMMHDCVNHVFPSLPWNYVRDTVTRQTINGTIPINHDSYDKGPLNERTPSSRFYGALAGLKNAQAGPLSLTRSPSTSSEPLAWPWLTNSDQIWLTLLTSFQRGRRPRRVPDSAGAVPCTMALRLRLHIVMIQFFLRQSLVSISFIVRPFYVIHLMMTSTPDKKD